MIHWRNILAGAAILLLATAGTAFGQAQSGNLYGTCVDNNGAALPGVAVSLSGGGAPQTQITDAQGLFRFLGLSPGSYALTAILDGYSTIDYPSITINVGRNTTLEITLSPAIEETITVTSESPLLDERAITVGATVSQKELEKIPSSRDPWTILQTVPGVKMDRINVGGNESGQQSQYVGPGSSGDNAVWAVDGVTITDMTAIGSSPTYYDFDAFEEMQVATGGTDISMATGGVHMNMVTKRGTNEWRGSGRYFLTDDSWQSDLNFDAADLGADQEEFTQGNRIVEIRDYGAEVGGPAVEDRLWIWASYGVQKPHLLTIQDVSDKTELETYSGKLNAQLTDSNSAVAFYLRGDKIKIGRDAGPTRPQETTWNQSGPTDVYKVEDTHVFSSATYLTGMYSEVLGGFMLTPQAGYPDGPAAYLDEAFVWHNNYLHYETDRPQKQANLDGSYFFNTGTVNHELKFGAGWRTVDVDSLTAWPQQQLNYNWYVPFGWADYNVVGIIREGRYVGTIDFSSLYVQNTMTVSDLTLNVGLRYDLQDGEMNSAVAARVAGFEDPDASGFQGLPDAAFAGGDDGFEWKSIAPRLGLTWALGEERKTLLRASFSQFADQLSHYNGVFQAWPIQVAAAYFYYDDLNGDNVAQNDEILPGLLWDNGYDPTGLTSPNQVDPSYDPAMTDEIILGLEHSLRPELVLGLNLTWRNLYDLPEFERLVEENGEVRLHQRSDYVEDGVFEGTLPDGSTYTQPYYGLRDGVTDTQGTYLTNGDREQDYLGLALTINKRLSNRWMLRGNVSWSTWEHSIPESELEDPNNFLGGANLDGQEVLFASGVVSGTKGGIYINNAWSYSFTGMYQIAPDRPWGFNASASIHGREGYVVPYYLSSVSLSNIPGTSNIQVVGNEDYRNGDVFMFDARLEKEFNVNAFSFTVSVDGFNLLNEGTVLQRQHNLQSTQGDWVTEIVSPRVFRAGVRFSFN